MYFIDELPRLKIEEEISRKQMLLWASSGCSTLSRANSKRMSSTQVDPSYARPGYTKSKLTGDRTSSARADPSCTQADCARDYNFDPETLPNFSQNTYLSHTCSTSIEAQIKTYIEHSSLNSKVPLSHPKPRDQIERSFLLQSFIKLLCWRSESLEFFLLLFWSRFILKRHSGWLAQARWRCTATIQQY